MHEICCGDWKPRTADGVDFVIGMPLYLHRNGDIRLIETEGGTLHQSENGNYYVIRWITDDLWFVHSCYASRRRALARAVEYLKAKRAQLAEQLREILQELKSAI